MTSQAGPQSYADGSGGLAGAPRLRLGEMGPGRQSPLNLNLLLAAVEAAPPVAAADVLAAALAEAIGAREVSFLIADFSGRSLIRLGHSGGEGALRLQGKETAERVPLVGTPHGRALAAQAVEVIAEDQRRSAVRAGDQPRRGDRRPRRGASHLPAEPADHTETDIRRRGPRAGLRRDHQPSLYRLVRVGPACGVYSRSRLLRSSVGRCPALSPARPPSSPWRVG